jgi:hypothetical protein
MIGKHGELQQTNLRIEDWREREREADILMYQKSGRSVADTNVFNLFLCRSPKTEKVKNNIPKVHKQNTQSVK